MKTITTDQLKQLCAAMLEAADKQAAPAGSHPASGCRNRVAVEQPDARQDTASAPPLPDQATGAPYPPTALALCWRGEAAKLRLSAGDGPGLRAQTERVYAAALESCAGMIETFCCAPRAQSEVEEGEPCALCGMAHPIMCGQPMNPNCPKLVRTGSRMERSGSGNDRIQP